MVQIVKKRTEVVNVCGKVIGEKQESLGELYECRAVRKGSNIARDTTHVLAKYYHLLPSGRRFRVPKFSTTRTKCSFVVKSVNLLNRCLIVSTMCVCMGGGGVCND